MHGGHGGLSPSRPQRQPQQFKLVERPLVDRGLGVHGNFRLQQDNFALLFGDGLMLDSVQQDKAHRTVARLLAATPGPALRTF